jgi:hypothetical protein
LGGLGVELENFDGRTHETNVFVVDYRPDWV